jgi:predicted enzyme related to lactoylglutathione lyase
MTPREQQRLSRVVWFEIPALNLDRAVRFYESILNATLRREPMGPVELAVFPYTAPAISGCLIKGGEFKPGAGAVVYLNAEPTLDAVRSRVEAAGGKVLMPDVTLPGDMGVYTRILDTEGNTVGLHALS